MDSLDNLPIPKRKQRILPEHNQILTEYFEGGEEPPQIQPQNLTSKITFVLYILILFIVCSNWLTESLVSRLPYVGGNKYLELATRSGLFIIVFIGFYKYYG